MVKYMKKFDGYDFTNNAIFVDIKKQSVFFKPIKKQHKFYLAYLTYLASFPLMFIMMMLSYFVFRSVFITITVLYYFAITPFVLVNLKKSEYYAKYNYALHYINNIIFFRTNDNRFKEVERKAIHLDKYFIIPTFSNVLLKYEVTGEYADKLKTIEISNIFKIDDSDFFAVFTFKPLSKKPDGHFKVMFF